jgi:hypothetical protein
MHPLGTVCALRATPMPARELDVGSLHFVLCTDSINKRVLRNRDWCLNNKLLVGDSIIIGSLFLRLLGHVKPLQEMSEHIVASSTTEREMPYHFLLPGIADIDKALSFIESTLSPANAKRLSAWLSGHFLSSLAASLVHLDNLCTSLKHMAINITQNNLVGRMLASIYSKRGCLQITQGCFV